MPKNQANRLGFLLFQRFYKGSIINLSTTLYLIRHGESEGNRLSTFLGHTDLPLTERGKMQADVTAGYLKEQNFCPKSIYSSDLTRAHSTAESTAKLLDMPIIKDIGLREINAGEWEGQRFEVIADKFAESYNVWLQNIGRACCDGGESVAELQARVVSTITRIADKHRDEVIFIFTHATPIRVFAAHCMNKTPDEIKNIPWASNASVTKATYSDGIFKLIEYGKDDFMGELVTRFSKNV